MSETGASPRTVERRLFLAVFVLAAALANPTCGDNDNRTIDLLRALERGRLSIDRDAANTCDKAFMPREPRAAAVALGDVAPASVLAGGHYYCGAGPGMAFLTLPVWLVARHALPPRALEVALVVFAGAFLLALSAIGVRRAVLAGSDASEEAATVAALVHGCGTIALAYATRFYAHTLVVCLFSWALALLLRRREREGEPRFALAGLLAGLAVFSDYNAFLPVLPLGVLALAVGGFRGGLAFAGGGAPVALALGLYQQACFGSPLSTPYDHHADPHIAWIYSHGNHGFTYPRPRIVLELLGGLRRGWLWTEPAVFLGVLGLGAAVGRGDGDARTRRVAAIALATTVLTLLMSASRALDWDAGASFGARYTASALPFVALGYPRGIALAGKAAPVVLVTSGLVALAGAVSDWGFSVVEVLARVLAFGPHLRGVARLVLGAEVRDVTLGTALASAAALSLALGVSGGLVARALGIVESRRLRLALGALALLPWLATLPFASAALLGGSARTVAERRRQLGVHEMRHMIRAASDAENARALVTIARGMARALDDPEILALALEKVAELDPADASAREAATRARAELRRP